MRAAGLAAVLAMACDGDGGTLPLDTGAGNDDEATEETAEKTELDERVVDYNEALRTASLKLVDVSPTLEQIRRVQHATNPKAAYEELLDEMLWEFDPDAYIPHQIAGLDEDDDLSPVLIVAPEYEAPMRPLVLNLRAQAVPGGFERVLEVVPADASAREPLRQRWKDYAARGVEVAKHDM